MKDDFDGENRVDSYKHENAQRVNIIPAGIARASSDKDGEDGEGGENKKATYEFDPNIDPRLEWAGKAEDDRDGLDVPIVPLHVHERMTSERIIRDVLKAEPPTLFEDEETRKQRNIEALEPYMHAGGWTNRLVAGDSLIVMNSLLKKESMAGKVQCVYMDPPYGIKYQSNFQAFTGKRDVKDGCDKDLPFQPEMVQAFRDTWELGIHTYLSYIRERLLLAKELLSSTGSCFVQIGDENVHLVRCVMDEIFGRENFVSQIVFRKTASLTATSMSNVCDYILWYAKDKEQLKFNQLYVSKDVSSVSSYYNKIELADGTRRNATEAEKQGHIPEGARLYSLTALTSQNAASVLQPFEFNGITYLPAGGSHWKTNIEGLQTLVKQNRIEAMDKTLRYVRYIDDFPQLPLNNVWNEQISEHTKIYVVQTATMAVMRCILMTTDPGDLVLDPTCGSGTTAFVAEQWGRRWITIDTSRVALVLAEKRLATATFDWYKLLDKEGKDVSKGFVYKTVPHVTLKSIANGEEPGRETLYDKPEVDKSKVRVAGPFTVEALPAPRGAAIQVVPLRRSDEPNTAPLARENTGTAAQWCEELRETGVRLKNGETLRLRRLEVMSGDSIFQAEGETDEENARSVLVYFGDARHTVDRGTVAEVLNALDTVSPKPDIAILAAFEFDAEAQSYIASNTDRWQKQRHVTVLHVLINNDLLTGDLRASKSDMSFFAVGQPDIKFFKEGENFKVEVLGFDYYSIERNEIISGGKDKIAVWMLDTDYDGLTITPTQIFFPMDGTHTWKQVKQSLRAEIDESKFETLKGCVSLPFKMRDSKDAKIAVKVVDDRGIESMRVFRRIDE